MSEKDSTNNGSSELTNLYKVSIRIPPFCPEKPEIWFTQVEAQFALTGITSETTKFNYLIAQLDLKTVENIYDIVKTDDRDKYTKAKERLLKYYKESEDEQIIKLVSELELGDLKPSQLLQKMRNSAGPEISDKLLKTLWLDKLLVSVKSILAISDDGLDKLGEIGDKIIEITSNPARPHMKKPSMNEETFRRATADRLNQVEARIAQLEAEVGRMAMREEKRADNLSRGPPPSGLVPSFSMFDNFYNASRLSS